jgi:rRNA maturation RNase YbeY
VSGSLLLRNRQHTRRVDLRFLRRLIKALLQDCFESDSFELGIYLVSAPEMTHFNETFLGHEGSTDVITFDYSENAAALLHAEMLICVDEAVRQARQFRTTWQSEVARYLIHGLLHLQGCDDARPAGRRAMKLRENRLLRELARQFHLAKLSAARGRNEASSRPAFCP